MRAPLAVGLGILLSRIAGLVRERVLAHYLGNSDAAGAFRAALRIPNLLQNLFGEGVLSASFIPVYARLLEEGKEKDAARVAGITFTLLALGVGVLAALGAWASEPLIALLAPGFSGDVRDVTVRMVRVMFPGTGLLVLSAWCLGILNSHRKFFLSYVAPVAWNVSMIALLVAVGARCTGTREGQMELGVLLAWSTVAGAALQLAVQLPSALSLNGGLRPGLSSAFAPMRTVTRNFVPALMSRGVVQLSAYVDQILASFLGAGVVSALAYAQTIYLLPVSLFGMSISSSELPEMARTTGSPEEKAKALQARLTKALRRLTFFIAPSAVAMMLLGDAVAGTLLQTGRFQESDSALVWLLLAGSALGLAATTKSRLCVSLFWALHDSKTPARYAFYRVALSAGLGWLIVFPAREALDLDPAWCAAGLAAAGGLAGWIEYALVRRALRRKVGEIDGGASSGAVLWIAAGLAAAAGWAIKATLPPLYPAVRGLLILGTYGAAYLALATLAGNAEAREFVSDAASRLRKKT